MDKEKKQDSYQSTISKKIILLWCRSRNVIVGKKQKEVEKRNIEVAEVEVELQDRKMN